MSRTRIGLEEMINTPHAMMLENKAGVKHKCDSNFGYSVNIRLIINDNYIGGYSNGRAGNALGHAF
eukprot:5615449-Ditylum_brightwellii.AAC.1